MNYGITQAHTKTTQEDQSQAENSQEEEVMVAKTKYAKAGKPRTFSSPDEMETGIVEYFQQCQEEDQYPTLSGLTLALGFSHRSSLYDYSGYGKEYSDLITRARLFVQEQMELGCHGKASQGFQFILNAGFGWATNNQIHETREIEISLGEDERQLLQSMGSKLIESKIVGSVPLKELQPATVPVERDE